MLNLIRFNKAEGFVKVYDGTRYLVLFGSEKYDSIYNRIRYLTAVKSGSTYIISDDVILYLLTNNDFSSISNTF